MLSALIEQDHSRGHSIESRILDLRHVDVKLKRFASLTERWMILCVSGSVGEDDGTGTCSCCVISSTATHPC